MNSEENVYIDGTNRHERVVRCIRQLVKIREEGTPDNNLLLNLYSGFLDTTLDVNKFLDIKLEDTTSVPPPLIWMQNIADQHGLHVDQVDNLIRIILDLEDDE